MEDEYEDTGVCKKCIAAPMAYCYSCTSSTICTKCISSFFAENSQSCVNTCPDDVGCDCLNSDGTTAKKCLDVAGK